MKPKLLVSAPATAEILKHKVLIEQLVTIEANQRAIMQGEAIILSLLADGTTEAFWLQKLAAIAAREIPKVSADVQRSLSDSAAKLDAVQKPQKN